MIIHLIKKLLKEESNIKNNDNNKHKDLNNLEDKRNTKHKSNNKEKKKKEKAKKKERKKISKRQEKRELKKQRKKEKRIRKFNNYSIIYIIPMFIFLLYVTFNLPYSQFFNEELVFQVSFTHLEETKYTLIDYEFSYLDLDEIGFDVKEGDRLFLTFEKRNHLSQLKEIEKKKPKGFHLKGNVVKIEDNIAKINTELPSYIKSTLSSGTNISSLSNKDNGKIIIKKTLGSYKVINILD